MAEAEDRTQAPSDKRLHQAREEGQAPLSRELVTFAGLAAAALMLSLAAPGIARRLVGQLQSMLAQASVGHGLVGPGIAGMGGPGNGGVAVGNALARAAAAWGNGAGFFMVVCAGAGAACVLLQTGFLLHRGAVAPQFGRLSPARGLKRVFGGTNLLEAGKALVKLGVLSWAFWRAMAAVWPMLGEAPLWTVERLVDQLGRELVHLLLLVVAAQAGIALLDTAWTRWRFVQRLRMSREDIKDEAKDAEGDPRLKAKLRHLRQARARRRMVAAVAKATVVVTNPTHYAVALAYDRGSQAAPRVVAKGVDEAAARIRAAAEKAGVTLVANPPLARALYLVALDAEVPAEHFRTVAEVIAYVWRLRGRVTSGQDR